MSHEAERALGDFQMVTQSMVLADADGRIGFVVTGRIPRRAADNDLRGIAPAPGWDARYDWDGYLPYARGAAHARSGVRRHRNGQ